MPASEEPIKGGEGEISPTLMNFILNTSPPEDPQIGGIVVPDSTEKGAVLQLKIRDNAPENTQSPDAGRDVHENVLASGMKALREAGVDVASGYVTQREGGKSYLSIVARSITTEQLNEVYANMVGDMKTALQLSSSSSPTPLDHAMDGAKCDNGRPLSTPPCAPPSRGFGK